MVLKGKALGSTGEKLFFQESKSFLGRKNFVVQLAFALGTKNINHQIKRCSRSFWNDNSSVGTFSLLIFKKIE